MLEAKSGFIPGVDQVAQRTRRMFRLLKGGHPSMAILHYSRGPPVPIPPQIANTPIRSYPLPPITEPGIFVFGDRAGQKVSMAPQPPPPGQQQQVPLQQQQQQQHLSQSSRSARHLAEHGARLEKLERERGGSAREGLVSRFTSECASTRSSLCVMRSLHRSTRPKMMV